MPVVPCRKGEEEVALEPWQATGAQAEDGQRMSHAWSALMSLQVSDL